MIGRTPVVTILMLLALPVAAQADRIRPLDYSPSPHARVHTELEWIHPLSMPGLAPDQQYAVRASVSGVEIRLDTSEYVGRDARIFITLPASVRGLSSTSTLTVSWRSRGFFESGQLVAGHRALLYAGPVNAPLTGDVLDFTIQFDAREFESETHLDFQYEIELF
jgi:hypothetical protein